MLNIRATVKSIMRLANGRTAVTIEAAVDPAHIEELGDDVCVDIKKWRHHRTKGQNAYFYACCNDIAVAMDMSVDEIHDKEIREFGVGQYMQLYKAAVDDFTKRWGNGLVRILCETEDRRGEPIVELIAYFGSKTYDTAEMSRLIDGTIQDMQALGLHIPAKEDWF